MSAFGYDPLDLGGRSFRLLRLFGGDGLQIGCEIFEAWLEGADAIPFEALSYAWGDLATPHTIELNGKLFSITENLHIALQNIRLAHQDRLLWVDAVCIDQTNHSERGHQVGHMGDIYSQAEQVIFWLGDATSNVKFVMTALEQLDRKCQKEAYSSWSLSDERWYKLWMERGPEWDERSQEKLTDGLRELLRRPWFQRVWILQEVALAERAVICAGSSVISSRVFAVAPTLIHVKPDLHCQAVLDIMPGMSRRTSWWSQRRDLYTLLLRFQHSKASDPRDMIFALLGISSGGLEYRKLQPDYTKTTEEVIDDATYSLFRLPPCRYRTMAAFLSHLHRFRSHAYVAIVKTGNAKDVHEFMRDDGGEFKIGVTELVAAARNEEFGSEVMQMLYTQPEDYMGEIVITAAIYNMKCGEAILRQLIHMPDQPHGIRKLAVELVVSAARLKIGCAPAFLQWLCSQHDSDLSELANRAVASFDIDSITAHQTRLHEAIVSADIITEQEIAL